MTDASISPRSLLGDPGHSLALGLGSGCVRKAPGTWGTLAGLLLYSLLFWLPSPIYLSVLVVAFVAGIYLCERTARALGVHDHPAIVWDEFVGIWLTLALQPTGLVWLLVAFVTFRVFDIIKPWPIGWLDRRMPGGLGIMIDDVVAGAYSLGLMALLQFGL
ncbi:MAG: phosphatidylglycerophosphatase A family protein [Pseudomonadota bacterium]